MRTTEDMKTGQNGTCLALSRTVGCLHMASTDRLGEGGFNVLHEPKEWEEGLGPI